MIYLENKFKVIFLGNSGVGKSSIINRYCNGFFESSYQPTVGIDFQKKEIPYEKRIIKLLFYDTAGQEKFRSLIPMYVRDAHIMVIVYDITNKDSFNQLDIWVGLIQDLKREGAILAIVGNKQDLEDRRAVETEEGRNLANKYNAIFREVSAKIGNNINELFNDDIVNKIVTTFNINEHEDIRNKPNNGFKEDSSNIGGTEIETNKPNSLRLYENRDEPPESKKKCCR